jgi:hypothetical protein
MPDLTIKDFHITKDVTEEDIEYHNKLRNSGEMSADHYEWKPVYDNEFTGPRFKYGLTNGMYSISTVPKGEIQNTYKPDDTSNGATYGTIEYPYALSEEQLTNFRLIDFQAIKTNVGEEGYTTWYNTETQAATAIKSMRDNGINADRVAQAYDSNSNEFKYKIYRSLEEIDKLNVEFAVKQASIQVTEKAAADELITERNNIDGFGSDLTPMNLGKTVTTLNKAIQVDGKPTTVKALVKKLVESGELASTEQHDVIKPMTRMQSFRANQKEQDAHEKKILDAGKKTVYYVGDYDLGKTAHDYAQHLISNRTLNTTTRTSKNFKQIAHDIIDHDVFRETVTKSIQEDGQKVLDAIFRGDIEVLTALNIKYAPEAGRNQGGGGAGPGKVKQPRRGAEPVYNASLIAINGFKKLAVETPINPRIEANAWTKLGEAVAFNLPPNGSVMKPTDSDFTYSAKKLGISIGNARRAWFFKMGDIEMPKTKAPEVLEAVAPVTLDPAAQKYLDDRQKHNDQADEHNRLRRVGQEALPGIRFADAAEVGRVFELKVNGKLTDSEWEAYKNQLISERRVDFPAITPADIDIERSLKWIDKEIAKTNTLFESKNVRIDLASPFENISKTDHDGAYMNGLKILNHAHDLKNACELRLQNDPQKYDFAAEQHKLEQAEYIISNINQHDLKNDVFRLDYKAAMGGNPLAHDHEDRRQAIIIQIDAFKKELKQLSPLDTVPVLPAYSDLVVSPEANLRDLWTKQGVSPERQEAILADITAKAQPGAMVGPFTIPQNITNPSITTPTGGNKMENTETETVPASTEFKITGAKLAEKFVYLEKRQIKDLAFLNKHLERIINMPPTIESPNKQTGEVFTSTKDQELTKIARTETINAMSNGVYVHNMNTMREMNAKRAAAPLSPEDDARYSKAKDWNARLAKEFTYKYKAETLEKEAFVKANPDVAKADIPKGPVTKQFNKAFYFNCTEKGIKDQIENTTTMHKNTSNMLAKVKELPEYEFNIKIKEQRNLPDLKYDTNFSKQLDTALAAKLAPAPATAPELATTPAPEQEKKPKGRSRK